MINDNLRSNLMPVISTQRWFQGPWSPAVPLETNDICYGRSQIAKLLMGGNMPIAYPYPAGMRSTRDLLTSAAI